MYLDWMIFMEYWGPKTNNVKHMLISKLLETKLLWLLPPLQSYIWTWLPFTFLLQVKQIWPVSPWISMTLYYPWLHDQEGGHSIIPQFINKHHSRTIKASICHCFQKRENLFLETSRCHHCGLALWIIVMMISLMTMRKWIWIRDPMGPFWNTFWPRLRHG